LRLKTSNKHFADAIQLLSCHNDGSRFSLYSACQQ